MFDTGYIRIKFSSQAKVSVPEIDDYKGIFERFLEAAATIPGNDQEMRREDYRCDEGRGDG